MMNVSLWGPDRKLPGHPVMSLLLLRGSVVLGAVRLTGGRAVRVARILGTLEPGGAQLFGLRLSVELRRYGIATILLAGDATPSGLELAARYGLPADAYRVSDVLAPDSLQWTPAPEFAGWLRGRLAGADLVHAHMVGAWWAAARGAAARAAGGQRAQPDVLARW
jgi:hypothetical protein